MLKIVKEFLKEVMPSPPGPLSHLVKEKERGRDNINNVL